MKFFKGYKPQFFFRKKPEPITIGIMLPSDANKLREELDRALKAALNGDLPNKLYH